MRISDWSSDVCSSDLDLAVGPAPDALWRSQSDLDLVKRLRFRRGVHEVHQFLVHAQVLPRNAVPLSRRERGKTLSGVVDDFGVGQLDIETKRTHFLDEHVEALRNAGLEGIVALDDRFVDLGAADHVVGFHRQHFLQGICSAIGLKRPDLHFAEALAAELCLRSEEHTSELQSLMRISYAVFCLTKKKNKQTT